MVKTYVRENVPLSRFGVLVAQLESIVASAAQQPPEPLLCFDLLSDLISAIDEEPKESILLWQRKCEEALYSLLILGARRPVRHLASVVMARIISKGDTISVYSRVSSLQGFLSDGKRNEPHKIAGIAQCLGELYQHFGRKITSGLLETTIIAAKLIRFNEDFVRQEALRLLQSALKGSGGSAAASAYTEAFRLITRVGIGDKSFIVRIAAARCLKAFANIGGPGLGVGELDNSASFCVKAFEDPISSVRDAFAEALGLLLALGMNPEAQVQPRGKGPFPPAKKLEGGLHRHLSLPFSKANGPRLKAIRVSLTLSWVFFLQAIRLRYLHPDTGLQDYALQVMDILRADTSVDAHSLACVLYILRVGITDQMTEPTQRSFLVFLGKQLQSEDASPSMKIACLRTLSYTLKTLGEVPSEFKEVLDSSVVAAVSHSSQLVRIEAALSLRTLTEVDPNCVGGLFSYGVTMLTALRENVSYEKNYNLQLELDSLHGQAAVLAALVSVSPKLPLGYPSRFPRSVLEVSKKMLTDPSRNPGASTVENEAGWLLLSSLLACMPKEELEDQVFDILSLWAAFFTGNMEHEIKQTEDLTSKICVWSTAIDALTAFIRCFISPNVQSAGVFLQPVIVYLSRVLSHISLLAIKDLASSRPALNILIIRTLIAYQSLPDPMVYKNDHSQIIQLCTTPFRDASGCEESSCLRLLLDRRDAWLGPWIPGRDSFEDELRAFQGGKDGLVPTIWEDEISNFAQPETINKILVNQMLLCFGVIFACQDSSGMLSLLGVMEQCLKTGKKQPWYSASVTNICVGLLAGFKALLSLRVPSVSLEILSSAQGIFQSIIAAGDICASQRRAAAEGLGLLARLGNDIFTARMIRSLLGDLTGMADSAYAGSIALALGCIHRSAGGMALSTLVTATVNSISMLARSSVTSLQTWALHGLLLTIEAAGLSYVSQVQATLSLALDILLSEENGLIDLQQGVGRLINAVVAVLGPELAPGSIFFSRCKSVVAEISSWQEASIMLESVRFTQQLALFAPQAVSVRTHLQVLLPTLVSKQPTLRHLAIATLRHLIEKDPVPIIEEQIEESLFHMLDEETDSDIANMVRTTIMRLLYASCPSCPSHWIAICRNIVLATSTRINIEYNSNSEKDSSNALDGDIKSDVGDDDENMVSSHKRVPIPGHTLEASNTITQRDKHLRYRTRVFAAECLSHLPGAVGKNAAHFDLYLAMNQLPNEPSSGDWLVLHVQELISLAYQISTIQFESMKPIGVGLLSLIIDKFEHIADPELPDHLLLEQYQAQLVSAVRSALDTSSGPILLEAGLLLATKILTSGIIDGDQIAVKRIFSLISRLLNDFKELYYPSFAEWVSCKIKVRLLAAHASLKCYTYALLRRHQSEVSNEYLALLPWFSKSSNILGKHWIGVLMDYAHTGLFMHPKKKWNPFLDGIQSPLVISKLQISLEESWPVILQAIALDAIPVNLDEIANSSLNNALENNFLSGYSMVELESKEYRFLWSFALFSLFRGRHPLGEQKITSPSTAASVVEDSPEETTNSIELKLYEIVLPVLQSLSTVKFCTAGFLTVDICIELLQVFSYYTFLDISWNSLALSVLSQIVQNCPESFLQKEDFAYLALELCLAFLFRMYQRQLDHPHWEDLISSLFLTVKVLMERFEFKKQILSLLLAFYSIGLKYFRSTSTEFCLSKVNDFIRSFGRILEKLIQDRIKLGEENLHSKMLLGTCMSLVVDLCNNCVEGIHLVKNKSSKLQRLLQVKLAFSLEQIISLGKPVYLAACLEEDKEIERVCFSVFKYGTECIRNVLHDSNSQVQAIGLQVLKGMTQKYTSNEEKAFLLFFVGELIGDILATIDMVLKKPITKESIAIAIECLRFLVLLQTLSNVSECQKTFMNLLLEAVVMIFSASASSNAKELDELRSTAIKLVSHLAQIPSSAVIFKDVILSMPVMHRQQLQGVIRASVTQDQNPTQKNLSTPILQIRAPAIEVNREKVSPPQTAEASTESNPVTVIEQDEDEDEDDDDWDTFQSFPASTREVITDNVTESREAEDSVLESSSPSVSMEDPTSLPIEHGETSEEVSMSISSTGQRSSDGDLIGERSGMQGVSDQESGNVDIALNEEHATEKEALPGQKRSQITEQVSSQLQLAEVVEDSAIVNSLEDHKPVDESPENQTELMPSDREILDNNADNDHVGEYEEGKEKDTVVKTWSVDDEQRNDSL
ncbi:protein SWEETIE isoform X2 [Cucurbita pepo subsp. pepo]|uniref:protein SWEETIE isoform X2 n=1 Tax=Cucurbita pepo subsp. pepo TaxID=3664 RepID=UPI000C9D71D3|nr:protein SWEETIE isoform X2 [Cucurbita pepo subsp. pepo]